jgi:hypothetical protein
MLISVGTSLSPGGVPTMVVNDNARLLVKRCALESIASKARSYSIFRRAAFFLRIKKPAEAGFSKTITTPCRQHSVQMADHP